MESEITVNGRELAEWLCVTPQAISKMTKEGRIATLPDSSVYPLKAIVQARIKELAGRKRGQGESKDLDRSLKYWQVEKAKQAVTSWRLQFGKEVALEILDKLDSALADFGKTISATPEYNEAALALAKKLKETRMEEALYGLDDLDGDDDEGASD